MSRINRWLLVLVAAEVIGCGIVVGRRLARPAPPEAEWALLDPATAAEIRTAARECREAADWRNLGELYMAAGCFRESEMCHREACRLAPAEPTYARQWAFALERLALLDQANAQYQRAIDLGHPDADGCAYFIARNHLRADRPAEARAEFAAHPRLDANRYELARLHLRDREFPQAAEIVGDLIARRPDELQVRQLAYHLELERGNERQALAHADAARYAPNKLLTPFDDEAARVVKVTQLLGPGRHWKAARDLIESGRLDDAEKSLAEAAQVYRSPAVDELTAEVALRRGRYQEAVALFQEFEARHGPSPRITVRIGDVWDAAGQPAKARECWLRAAGVGAGLDLRTTHYKLAQSFAAAGDKTAAERHLARGHYFSGRDVLQAGFVAQAAGYFEGAVKADPGFTQAWFYLGEARRLGGQPGPAAEAYQTCLRLSPDHGRALAGLALLKESPGK